MATKVDVPYSEYVDDLEQALMDLREVLVNDLDRSYWDDPASEASLAAYVTNPRSQRALRTATSRALAHS